MLAPIDKFVPFLLKKGSIITIPKGYITRRLGDYDTFIQVEIVEDITVSPFSNFEIKYNEE